MSKARSRMTRDELDAYAASIGIEDPASIGTVKELQELIDAFEAASPDAPAPPQPTDPAAPEADRDEERKDNVPDGCVHVRGIGRHGHVAFFERDARHPGGEVFITSGQERIVFRTPRVERALRLTLHLIDQG